MTPESTTLKSRTKRTPFLVLVRPHFDESEVARAIAETRLAYDDYDPESQMAKTPLQAGSARTYSSTFSGLLAERDDDRVSDS